MSSADAADPFSNLFTGDGSYSFPIDVLPGGGGIAPSVGLSYSSTAGRSFVGHGWSLHLGSITRQGPNGKTAQYGAQDEFFLDGKKLTFVRALSDSEGLFQVAEEQSFLKIIRNVDANTWAVKTPDGSRMDFSVPIYRLPYTSGFSNAHTWQLGKVTSAAGYFARYLYTVPQSDPNFANADKDPTQEGDVYPSKIEYTFLEGDPAFDSGRTVEFKYIDRGSFGTIPQYAATGSRVIMDRLLSEIVVSTGRGEPKIYKSYSLIYDSRAVTPDDRNWITPEPKLVEFKVFGEPESAGSRGPLIARYGMEYAERERGWEPTAESMPWFFVGYVGVSNSCLYGWPDCETMEADRGVRFINLDGDPLPDLIKGETFLGNWTDRGARRNLGVDPATGITQWQSVPVSAPPIDFAIRSSSSLPSTQKVAVVDLDGNGRDELVWIEGAIRQVYLLQADGSWEPSTNWGNSLPTDVVSPDFENLDGDRFPDLPGYLNPGAPGVAWIPFSSPTKVENLDINGDGLADIVKAIVNSSGVYEVSVELATGNGAFERDPILEDRIRQAGIYTHQEYSYVDSYGNVSRWQVAGPGRWSDVNADGMPDWIQGDELSLNHLYGGFLSACFRTLLDADGGCTPFDLVQSGEWTTLPNGVQVQAVDDMGAMLVDVKGAGVPAFVQSIQQSNGPSFNRVFRAKGKFPGLLKKVTDPNGGVTEFEYTPSTELRHADGTQKNPNLPYVKQLLTAVIRDDLAGSRYVVSQYDYENGLHDRIGKKFLGFGRVTVTSGAGQQRIVEFHQTDWLLGAVKTASVLGSDGKTYARSNHFYTTDMSVQDVNTVPNCLETPDVTNFDCSLPYANAEFATVTYTWPNGTTNPASCADDCMKFRTESASVPAFPDLDHPLVTSISRVKGDPRSTPVSEQKAQKVELVSSNPQEPGNESAGFLMVPRASYTYVGGDEVTGTLYFESHNIFDKNGNGKFDAEEAFSASDTNPLPNAPPLLSVRSEFLPKQALNGLPIPSLLARQTDYDPMYKYPTDTWDMQRSVRVAHYDYDPAHLQVIGVSNALGFRVRSEYDPFGRRFKAIDEGNNLAVETKFDHRHRVEESKTYPNSSDPSNPANLLSHSKTEYIGVCDDTACPPANPKLQQIKTKSRYSPAQLDENQWPTSITFVDGLGRSYRTVSNSLDENGNVTFVASDVEFDGFGRAKRTSAPFTVTAPSAFGERGVYWTESEFDALGRVFAVNVPAHGGGSIRYETNVAVDSSAGQSYALRTQTRDAVGNPKETYQDLWGRMFRVAEHNRDAAGLPIDRTMDYRFDLLGNLSEVIDSAKGSGQNWKAQKTIQVENNSLGQKHILRDTDAGTWRYAYDAQTGRLFEQIDAKGNATRFYFDDLDRLVRKEHFLPGLNRDSDIPTSISSFYYDALFGSPCGASQGKLVRQENEHATTDYCYDSLGRLSDTSVTIDGITRSFGRTYNDAGQIQTHIYDGDPNGGFGAETLTYDYDAKFGRLTGIESSVAGLNVYVDKDHTKYDVLGRLREMRFGNGVSTRFEFNVDDQRLSDMRVFTDGGLTPLWNRSFTYDLNGNLRRNENQVSGGATDYVYDKLHRLVSATEFTQSGTQIEGRGFTFDPMGRMSEIAGAYNPFPEGGAVTATSASAPAPEPTPTATPTPTPTQTPAPSGGPKKAKLTQLNWKRRVWDLAGNFLDTIIPSAQADLACIVADLAGINAVPQFDLPTTTTNGPKGFSEISVYLGNYLNAFDVGGRCVGSDYQIRFSATGTGNRWSKSIPVRTDSQGNATIKLYSSDPDPSDPGFRTVTAAVEWYGAPAGTTPYFTKSVDVSFTSTDTVKPTTPSVSATPKSGSQIDLSFGAYDAFGVTKYEIFRDAAATPTATVTVTLTNQTGKYTDSGLAENSTHTYSVVAIDLAGNRSAPGQVSSRTLDVSSPLSFTLTATPVSPTKVNLTWTTADNPGGIGYKQSAVYRGNNLLTYVTGSSYLAKNLSANTNYTFKVRNYDLDGNFTDSSASIRTPATDTVRPNPPTTISATTVSAVGIDLSWNGQSDNEAVKTCNVYRSVDGGAFGAIAFGVSCFDATAATYQDRNVGYGRQYQYYVTALDAVPLESDPSPKTALINTPPDTIAPSVPSLSSVRALGETQAEIVWSAATDNDPVTVVRYDVFRGPDGVVRSNVASPFVDSGLSAAGTYTYTVRAKDLAGNLSAPSNALSVTTEDNSLPTVPSDVRAIALSPLEIQIEWDPSSDVGFGVLHYNIFKDGNATPFATSSIPQYVDSTVTAGSTHRYAVSAVDADVDRNESAKSGEVTITTPSQSPSTNRRYVFDDAARPPTDPIHAPWKQVDAAGQDVERYRYDPNGNLMEVRNGSGQILKQFEFNVINKLAAVTAGGIRVEYLYGPNGERVARRAPNNEGQIETIRYFGAVETREDLTVRKFIFFGGLRVAERNFDTGQVLFHHKDQQGSTVGITDGSSQSEVMARDYYEGGATKQEFLQGGLADFGYTDQRLDDKTKLHDYHARYYDSANGFFISPDSIVPNPGRLDDFNRYMYVGGNPVNYIDPTGHFKRNPRTGCGPEGCGVVGAGASRYTGMGCYSVMSCTSTADYMAMRRSVGWDSLPDMTYRSWEDLHRAVKEAGIAFAGFQTTHDSIVEKQEEWKKGHPTPMVTTDDFPTPPGCAGNADCAAAEAAKRANADAAQQQYENDVAEYIARVGPEVAEHGVGTLLAGCDTEDGGSCDDNRTDPGHDDKGGHEAPAIAVPPRIDVVPTDDSKELTIAGPSGKSWKTTIDLSWQRHQDTLYVDGTPVEEGPVSVNYGFSFNFTFGNGHRPGCINAFECGQSPSSHPSWEGP